jgi:L-aspartate oxidase
VVDADERPIVDPLPPRDVVARAVARFRRDHGPAFLSLRHLEAAFVRGRFPNIAVQLDEWGLDLARDLLPIAPAAHYCMGGVRTDRDGRTDLPGLYVAGEAACSGVQGANRLASNSLLECLVFGRRAATAALADGDERRATWDVAASPEDVALANLPTTYPSGLEDAAALGARLDRDLGVERNADDLAALVADLPEVTPETSGDQLVAALAARAALLRRESRGAHFRTDATATEERWRGRIHWRRSTQAGSCVVGFGAVG